MIYQDLVTKPRGKNSADLSITEWQRQAMNLKEEFGQEQIQINFRIQTLLRELGEIVQRDWCSGNL